jgi:hypothetical protein
MKTAREFALTALAFLVFFFFYFLPAEFGKLMASGDAVVESIPALLGPHNLWEPAMLLGYPLFADPNQQYWYPLSWVVHAVPHAFNAYAIAPFVLAAFGMAGFVRSLTQTTASGIIAGLIYALSGFMISHAGHLMISHPAAWAPFVLWALESVRRRPGRVPVVAGAIALGLCGVAGQPQIFVFTVTLAIAFVLASAWLTSGTDPWRFVARAFTLVALGVAFAGPELIPSASLAGESTRASLNFSDFTVFEIPPDQLALRILFPYVFGGSPMPWFPFGAGHVGEFTEQTIAVGSIALTLALLATRLLDQDRRVVFWYAVAAVALLLAVGDATPLASIVHEWPVYGLLRIPARHAFEWTFAVAVLAGYGWAAIAQARARTSHVVGAFAVVAVIAGASYAMLVAGHPAVLSQIVAIYGAAASRTAASPLVNGAIGIPLATGLIGVGLLWSAARTVQHPTCIAFVIAAVVLDLGCFGWSAYWRWETTSWDALVGPSWALRLGASARAAQTRINWLPGVFANALSPNLNLLWRVPLTGGYTPLRPRRLDALLGITDYGANSASPDENDAAFDLAGTGFAVAPISRDSLNASHPFASDDIGRFVGAAGESPHASAAFGLPSPFAATRIMVVSDLGDSPAIPDDAVVAELQIVDVSGRRQNVAITAGRDTSEVAYDRTDVRPLVRHRRARVFSGDAWAHHYLAVFPIATHLPVARVSVRWIYPDPTRGGITIEKLSLVDDRRGTATAFNGFAAFYAAPEHWRAIDVDPTVTAFANRQVMPRAWLALPIRLDAASAVTAIHDGRFPDGSRFDLRREATTEETVADVAVPNNGDVARVVEDAPRRMTVATACLRPCFLVVRDAFDPQWRATVDAVTGTIVPADLALRGIAVPAGVHTVTFTFWPISLYLGLGACGAAAILSIVLLFWPAKGAVEGPLGVSYN